MNYFLEVTLCWAIFYGIYHLLLRSETFHRTNRWYLIGTLLLGLAIPVVNFDWMITEKAPSYLLQPITIGVQELEAIVITASQREQGIDSQAVAIWIYWLGVAVAMSRFGFGLWQIQRLYQMGEVAKQSNYDLVTTSAPHLPFSFFRNLFWSKNFVTTEEERRSIVRHEEAHIFQKHSHDVLLLELVAAFAWCVPFVYFYKKALKTTHEYLADAHVTAGFDKKQYGRLLLRQSIPASKGPLWGKQVAISNSLFSSQLKKRIVMMTKTKSAQRAALKYLAVLPAVAVLLMAFSFAEKGIDGDLLPDYQLFTQENGQILNDTVPNGDMIYSITELAAQFPGDEGIPNKESGLDYPNKHLMEFISQNLRYPKAAREKGLQGMVFVSFTVEKDGSISNPEIKGSRLGGGCEEEVLRIVSMMPKWKPAEKDGKPVRSRWNLPVNFKLDNQWADAAKTEPAFEMGEVDEMPIMAGCEDLTGEERKKCSEGKMLEAIFMNVKYPTEAREKGIEGTVFVKFVIQKDGSVANIETVKSVGYGCDEEVIRVVANMPKWVPAKKDGKPVAVSFMLPVKFKLDGEPKPKPLNINDLDEVPVMACCEGLSGEKRQNCSNSTLMGDLFSKVSYPKEARAKGIEGTVYVKFTIETDGNVANPEIIRSVGGGCDEEVIRVLRELRWSPGKKDGKVVASSMTLPVKFKLDALERKAEIFEVYPNPAGASGFNVKFKAPAGPTTVLVVDAEKAGDAFEKAFMNYDGTEQTVHFSTNGFFKNGASKGSLIVYLLGENGAVVAKTTLIVH